MLFSMTLNALCFIENQPQERQQDQSPADYMPSNYLLSQPQQQQQSTPSTVSVSPINSAHLGLPRLAPAPTEQQIQQHGQYIDTMSLSSKEDPSNINKRPSPDSETDQDATRSTATSAAEDDKVSLPTSDPYEPLCWLDPYSSLHHLATQKHCSFGTIPPEKEVTWTGFGENCQGDVIEMRYLGSTSPWTWNGGEMASCSGCWEEPFSVGRSIRLFWRSLFCNSCQHCGNILLNFVLALSYTHSLFHLSFILQYTQSLYISLVLYLTFRSMCMTIYPFIVSVWNKTMFYAMLSINAAVWGLPLGPHV